MKQQKSFYPKKDSVDKVWYLIDAEDQVLGRLASQVARIVRGKNKAVYTPAADTGDYVVIINADKVRLTGNKSQKKVYYRHTGYPGGIKKRTYNEMMEKRPTNVLTLAIQGMLPHNTLGRKLMTKVKIYAGDKHPHEAQNLLELQSSK
jgi:large subunit ribosomal protein L13